MLRRLGRGVRPLGKVMLVTGIGLALLHSGLNVWASVLLNRELGAIRERGEPLTLPEVFARPDSARPNAAPLYLEADAGLQLTPELRQQLSAGRSTAERAIPTALLEQNAAALAEVRAAARLPQCRFDVDWSNPITARLEHLNSVRRLGRLVGQQARRNVELGRRAEAVADLETLFRMSRHVAEEPILIPLLVGLSLEETGYAALAYMTAAGPLGPAEAERVAEILPQPHWAETLARAMMGERSFGVWFFDNEASDPIQLARVSGSSDAPAIDWPLPVRWALAAAWAPFRKLDEATYLRYMNQRVALANRLFSDGAERGADTYERLPAYAVGTRLLVPVYRSVLYRLQEAEVHRRLAVVALALDQARALGGRYPDSLPPTLGDAELPMDPHAGAAFHYVRRGGDYLLYGVGPNRRDDGGVKDRRRNRDDIPWSALAGQRGR